MTVGSYQTLEQLARTERYVLHRGRRAGDGGPVLLKSPCGPVGQEALERESGILSRLSLPGVPGAGELVWKAGGPCLVLQDPGGEPLARILERGPFPLPSFLLVALRLCEILDSLHRLDVVCGSLHPQGILVDPEAGQTFLVDLGLAWWKPQGFYPLQPAGLLREALVYAAPEQTGRMSRVPDYRADFYSLGAVFYEILTGGPPFRSDDPLELIHAHVARNPRPPAELRAEIPEPLSRLVMKLLAKTAEDRYQSASGLKQDLETCSRAWSAHGAIDPFPLGQRDVPDRFLIPERLYGRDPEVEALARAFDRTCQGPSAMTVVAGYPGVGKTALIQELYRPIVRQRGYFLAGKFDPVARNVPYGALLQAFRALVRQLLTESEDRLAAWRARLTEALGASGGVLAEVIPEIEMILGKQPAAPPLPPAEAQNRFRRVFQSFVGSLARNEHPLVVFLDDLQWADSASLALLGPLLSSPEVRYLLLIGAYRDNEVDAGHPLSLTLASLEAAGALIERIPLRSLGFAPLARLIRDALHCEGMEADPLAHLVLTKTEGNPFFVIQFLKMLERDGLLSFDHAGRHWTFRLEEIARAPTTGNVVDLMARKIQQLPPETQRVLTLAASIGNTFDGSTLGVVSRLSERDATERLQPAVDEGLVVPSFRYQALNAEGAPAGSVSYTFLHDRVQQAAYAGIPEVERPRLHLTVGRLLRERGQGQVFDVAFHLNLGSVLMDDESERIALARVNLEAGRKAKSSTAYQGALGYFAAGLGLLQESHWSSEHALMLALSVEAAECKYLCGQFEEAEHDFVSILAKARSLLDRARIYNLWILQYEYRSRYADAIRIGRQGLALFGMSYPDRAEDKWVALEAEVAAIDGLVRDRSIESLAELPVMDDPRIRTLMRLLANLHTSCYLVGDKPLTLLNTARMVRLSLAHGNLEESAYAYALYAAMLLGPIRGDYASAYEFGLLALKVSEKLPDPAARARTLMTFAWAISIWRRPLEESFPITREAFRLGNDTGLFVDAAYALFNESWFYLLAGRDLATFQSTYAPNVDYIRRVKMEPFALGQQVVLQWGKALQGLTESPVSLSDAGFDEEDYRQSCRGQSLFEMFYLVGKLALLYTFEEHEAASQVAERAEDAIRDFPGTIWDELRVFYHALALAALPLPRAAEERQRREATLAALGERLERWAENSPHLFRRQHLILSAEMARVGGRSTEAMTLYETALAAADQGCPRERALAAELCGRFWLGQGMARLASLYLGMAHRAYAEWGAVAKLRHLEQRYGVLLAREEAGLPALAPGPAAAPGAAPLSLDVASVSKAAHALAVEIVLEDLLRKLMRIALENAGAQRGFFFQEKDGQLVIEAEGHLEGEEAGVLLSAPLEGSKALAASVVRYVQKTGESVVLGEASADDRFASDPYIVAHQPRSILCLPVVHQGKLGGILYLENNLAGDAFTAERIKVLNILSSQAAISLENARLYDDMKREVAARRRAEAELRTALGEVQELQNQLQAENVYLQEEIRVQHNFEEMVGGSPAFLEALDRVERVAATDSTVLILGETGTGKELIARAVHDRSARKGRALVKVDCGAISAGLAESELFGHVKGAFTGALTGRVGRFELADGGTIFLDEVGELPPDHQVKLLRVLQEQEFEPVGGTRTVRVDVRVIAATNRDLAEAVRRGRFRSDLYYRLSVFPISVPPLRERRSDIPALVAFFLSRFMKKLGKKMDGVSKETMDLLLSYSWPGNVRELQNVIERAVILSRTRVLVLEHDLLPVTASSPTEPPSSLPGRETEERAEMTPGVGLGSLEDIERRHILATLRRTSGVIEGPAGAAIILNLHPNTLRSRMKKLGIKRPANETMQP